MQKKKTVIPIAGPRGLNKDEKSCVLFKIDIPVVTCKSKRMFKLTKDKSI